MALNAIHNYTVRVVVLSGAHNITSTQTSIHTTDQNDPGSFLQFKLWRTITFLNLNEIGQIKRHEKAEIKGYPFAFSDYVWM